MKRRRKLPPMPPPTYVTLAEVVQAGMTVTFDELAPADKKRESIASIGALDDLPTPIRMAIKEASLNAIFFMRDKDGVLQEVNFVTYSVNLLDIGLTVEQIVTSIRKVDAQIVETTGAKMPP